MWAILSMMKRFPEVSVCISNIIAFSKAWRVIFIEHSPVTQKTEFKTWEKDAIRQWIAFKNVGEHHRKRTLHVLQSKAHLCVTSTDPPRWGLITTLGRSPNGYLDGGWTTDFGAIWPYRKAYAIYIVPHTGTNSARVKKWYLGEPKCK